jgi:hypothetical protein
MDRMIFTILLALIGSQSQALAQNPQAEFLKAVAAGKVTEVRQMLSTNPRLAHMNASSGISALLYAAYNRQPQVAAVLMPYRKSDLTTFESAALGENTKLLTLLRQTRSLSMPFRATASPPCISHRSSGNLPRWSC